MTDSSAKPRARNTAPNIIAVASGKGGVGKTWFSVTLAHALVQKGKKVLLFDGDLGLANVDVQLGLMPKHDLNDVIKGKLSLKRVIQKHEDTGFDIIAGQSGTAALTGLPNEHVMRIKQQLIELAAEYDYVVLDLGAGIDRTVRLLSSAAEKIIVLTNEEPTALTDAYAFIKLTYTAGLADTVKLVINAIPSKTHGERIYNTLAKACDNFLKFRPPLLGMIRHDKKVGDSIRNQTPLLVRYPNTEAAVDIDVIAQGLIK
jgi:flagellar biosynthesis protein FlhG